MKKKKILIILLITILIGLIQSSIPQKQNSKTDSQFIELSKGKIAYKEFGEGNQTMIIIHGSPGGKNSMYNLASKINNKKVYVLDMYGFGESEKYVKNYGIESSAQIIKEFIDKKQIIKTDISGYSWGGGVAINFAYFYPEKTENLILIASMGIIEGEATKNYYTEQLRYYLSYPFVTIYPGSFAGDYSWRHGFLRSFMDSNQKTIREKLQQISAPSIIIHGKDDTVIPMWVAEEHNKLLKNSKIFYFNGGHGTIFNHPDEIAEIMNNNLQ